MARLIGTAHRRWEQRPWEDAKPEYRARARQRARELGPAHRETLLARRRQAVILRKSGQLTEAEEEFRVLAAELANLLGAEHRLTRELEATMAGLPLGS